MSYTYMSMAIPMQAHSRQIIHTAELRMSYIEYIAVKTACENLTQVDLAGPGWWGLSILMHGEECFQREVHG